MIGFVTTLVLLLCWNCIILGKDSKEPTSSLLEPIISLNHGVNLPRIGLGTAGLREHTRNIVKEALSAGIRLIDTAQAYEWYDEAAVGQGINDYLAKTGRTSSENIVLVTKIHPRSFLFEKMKVKVLDSIENLVGHGGNERPLDVVLLHSTHCWQGHCTPEEEAISWQTGWRSLESLKSIGLVLNIGVSNFDETQLNELLDIRNERISVIQNWMDPFHQDVKVRTLATQHKIIYMAYSSFGTQWEWKLGYNPVFENSLLKRLAEKYKTSISQIVLSWLIQEEVVAIPRSSSIEHVKENAALWVTDKDGNPIGAQIFLEDEDIEAIRALDGTLGELWG